MTPTLALKVDVASYRGTRDGVPRLLEILGRCGIRATFYFSLGPDTTGKALRRIFTRPGFLRQLARSRGPFGTGFTSLLYGILLPPPMIGASQAEVLREAAHQGHEVGIHAWDPVKWEDLLPWLPKRVALLELGRASALFEEIFGRRCTTTAAPGWIVTPDALEIQDALQLDFCSDTRGSFPFYPVMGGRRFRTLQIPTTLPPLDELLGAAGSTSANVHDRMLERLRPGLNVHTVRAELEGMSLAASFGGFLERLQEQGCRFLTLGQAAAEARQSAPPDAAVVLGEVPGRPGSVARQVPQ